MYNKNFLTDVFLRYDYSASQPDLQDTINKEFRTIVLEKFPIMEEKESIEKQVQVSIDQKDSVIVNEKRFKQWIFWDISRKNCLQINADSIVFVIKSYTKFSDLRELYTTLLKGAENYYPSIKFKRIGLRYVDQIELDNKKRVNKWYDFWKKYINLKLLKGIDFCEKELESGLTRQMNLIETDYGDFNVRFQYGIFNSDYPAINKKKVFVLDTDVYATGIFEYDECDQYIINFHQKAKNYFEKSIRESLKIIMGSDNGAED